MPLIVRPSLGPTADNCPFMFVNSTRAHGHFPPKPRIKSHDVITESFENGIIDEEWGAPRAQPRSDSEGIKHPKNGSQWSDEPIATIGMGKLILGAGI